MKKIIITLLLLSFIFEAKESFKLIQNRQIITHIVDLKKSDLMFFLKDDKGNIFQTFQNLNSYLVKKNKKLVFAMNGGMYMPNFMPQGLYVEKGNLITKTNRVKNAYGNFYMQPNGVFFITKQKKAYIKPTTQFHIDKNIDYATQSGPMLLIEGKIHHRFRKGSHNLHIRNGVGILPNGNILFAISKKRINFYDFASFFKNNGCKNALYLDGFVSKIYLPLKDKNFTNSRFGVIIGETQK